MLKVHIETDNPFTNVCWVSVLTTFSRRHKFWLHRQFRPPRNEEMMGDGFLMLLLPVCFEQ